jgi:hypothetical protein
MNQANLVELQAHLTTALNAVNESYHDIMRNTGKLTHLLLDTIADTVREKEELLSALKELLPNAIEDEAEFKDDSLVPIYLTPGEIRRARALIANHEEVK